MKFSPNIGHALLGIALFIPVLSCHAQQVSLPPQSFLSREQVKINVTTTVPFSIGRESVAMVNNRLTVTLRAHSFLPPAGPVPPFRYVPATTGDVVLGKLPEGSYAVEVVLTGQPDGSTSIVGAAQFVVADDPVARQAGYPAYDFTDIWFNALQPGWGISIHTKRDKLFAAWFVYDATGKPTWYTLQQGSWETSYIYNGLIFATTANPNAGIGPLTHQTTGLVGSGTITFTSTGLATLYTEINNGQVTTNMTRDVF